MQKIRLTEEIIRFATALGGILTVSIVTYALVLAFGIEDMMQNGALNFLLILINCGIGSWLGDKWHKRIMARKKGKKKQIREINNIK